MTAIHLQPCGERIGRRDPRHAALDALNDATLWVFATLHQWRRRSRDRAELATLDARTLADIGLTQGEAEFLASKPFWKE
jgi:uncharacterized protein YjiS (DUF1127 family)